jgi:hypothetical protein
MLAFKLQTPVNRPEESKQQESAYFASGIIN